MLAVLFISLFLSADAFAASFAYGNNKIKIPITSAVIINIICSAILGASLLAGVFAGKYIPKELTIGLSFLILFILGCIKLMDSITKAVIRKYNHINKQIDFSMFNFRFILNLYANPADADVDSSKVISPMEAVSLALALSLDSIAAGFGAALGNVNILSLFVVSLIMNAAAISFGCRLGLISANNMKNSLSWMSGTVLIILAFAKLLA